MLSPCQCTSTKEGTHERPASSDPDFLRGYQMIERCILGVGEAADRTYLLGQYGAGFEHLVAGSCLGLVGIGNGLG